MSNEKIIAAEDTVSTGKEAIITGEEKVKTGPDAAPREAAATSTLQERMAAATKEGGLKSLPNNFDDAASGDWNIIKSSDPFATLYLDYRQAVLITPDVVKTNYELLYRFWQEKVALMNTGGNRAGFKSKYGDGVVEASLTTLKRAFDKLSTAEGINRYYQEINGMRLRNGAEKLRNNIEQMVIDGDADKDEIIFCLKQGLEYELAQEETAQIIKKRFDELGLLAYGTANGSSQLEQLLSVDHWMTQAKQDEAERIRKDREALKIQILKGRFANTIEEIGTILFEDPAEAKEIIKEDLLKQTVGQKDIVLARDIANITKNEKDLTAAFYKIVYRLNPTLPYPFMGREYKTVSDLCIRIFEDQQTMKQGKEDLQKGYIEAWLKETDTKAYSLFLIIRDSAANLDLALLSFLYTFSPQLPYRLAGSKLITSPLQLSDTIDSSNAFWEAGKTELFNGSIPVWLAVSQKSEVPTQWNTIKEQFADHQDIGLEKFLQLLNHQLPQPQIAVSPDNLTFPKVQSGQVVTANIVFTNISRGAIEGYLEFSKPISGVSLSAKSFIINNTTGESRYTLQLTIDTTTLLKGVEYETSVRIRTSAQQELVIPLSFNIVFPQNAFLKQIALAGGISALFFALVRLIPTWEYADWLSFDFYIDWDTAGDHMSELAIFGWTMLLFAAGLCSAIYFLIKYLKRK